MRNSTIALSTKLEIRSKKMKAFWVKIGRKSQPTRHAVEKVVLNLTSSAETYNLLKRILTP